MEKNILHVGLDVGSTTVKISCNGFADLEDNL